MTLETPADPVASHLPLSPLTLEILLPLIPDGAHGYGILKEIEASRSFPSTVPTSTIYRALHRLREAGFVREVPDAESPAGADSRRRCYRLTERGLALVRAELSRLDRVRSRARARGLIA